MDYLYLDTDEKIAQAVGRWNGMQRIAVDFEGEFNLHIYGEHLCLIQVFDGKEYFIIDPRSSSVTPDGLRLFFASPVEKVWFDAQSDASLVHKNYDAVIENIFDIRVLASVLGYTGNLTGLEERYLGIEAASGGSKKRNQTSNWLRRPLPQSQIEYALEDVRYLLDLKDTLVPLVREAGLEERAAGEMRKALRVKTPEPGWKKVGDWRRMSRRERIYVRHIFLARDRIARRFNVPAVGVMEKRLIPALAADPPHSIEALEKRLKGQGPRFMGLLLPAVWKAIEDAEKEAREDG